MMHMTEGQLKEYCHLIDDKFGDGGAGRFDNYDDYIDHFEDLFGDAAPDVDRDLFNKLLGVSIDINYYAQYQYVSVTEDMMFTFGFAMAKLAMQAIEKEYLLYYKADPDLGYVLVVGFPPSQLSIGPVRSGVPSNN